MMLLAKGAGKPRSHFSLIGDHNWCLARPEEGKLVTEIAVRRLDYGYFVRPGAEMADGTARVEPCLGYLVDHPDGLLLFDTGMGARPDVDAHYRPRRQTLAEALAGVGPRLRRRGGPLRATHHRRRARALLDAAAGDVELTALVRAGARLDPRLALRALTYALPVSWTAGHAFTVQVSVDGETTTLEVGGGGLRLAEAPPSGVPTARLRLTRAAFDALLAGDEPDADGVVVEGDRTAVRTVRGWTDRLRTESR